MLHPPLFSYLFFTRRAFLLTCLVFLSTFLIKAQTVSCNGLNQWQPFQRYEVAGTAVYLNGLKYSNQYYTYNQSPDVNNGPILPNNAGKPWHLEGTCAQPIVPLYVNCNNVAVWNGTTAYAQGQSVTYNGLAYTARWGNNGQQPNLNDVWQIQGTCLASSLVVSGTVTNFTTLVGSPSAPQTFTVTGTNLSGSVTVTAPGHFEVALAAAGPFSSSLSLPTVNGNVTALVYIRYNSSVSGTFTGQVVVSAAGVANQVLNVSGNGTGIWQVNGTNIFNGNTGNVGIGTNTPTQRLEVVGKIKTSDDIIFNGTTSLTAALASAGQWTQSGNNLTYNYPNGKVGIGADPALYADAKLSVGGNVKVVGELSANAIVFSDGTRLTGSTLTGFDFGAGNASFTDGRVNIGHKLPTNSIHYLDYLLSVQGKVVAKQLYTETKISWPDYVFDDDHTLIPLNELEEYLHKNKHLPEVPAAQEISNTGINVGEMNALLLKKIEELTLYIIDLKKENERIKSKLEMK